MRWHLLALGLASGSLAILAADPAPARAADDALVAPCPAPCDDATEADLGASAAESGRTSCEIERGDGGDDWIVRIKRQRGGQGPKTSRCAVGPTRDADADRPGAPPRGPDGPAPRAPSQPR